jgi:hypothetical protein
LQASPRRRRPAVVQDENLQPGLSRYTQATQAQVRFLNSICYKINVLLFGKNFQVERSKCIMNVQYCNATTSAGLEHSCYQSSHTGGKS